MKFHFGDLPENQEEPPEAEQWQRLHSPSSRFIYLFAALIGLMIPSLLCIGLGAFSWMIGGNGNVGGSAGGDPSSQWGVVALGFLLSIPVHETIHAIWHPGWGLSSKTVMVIWPSKLRFGVYYDGCMTRRRWLWMRIAPLVMLSVLPAGLLALSHFLPIAYHFDVFLEILMLVNGVGSGADLVAVVWVLFRVPARAQIGFYGGLAYWRPVVSSEPLAALSS